ncbi:sodium-dependent transporter bedraggled isoform X2 [Musca autumnalis]|uniref:sodium-dependent transporter bedraggled isoform X2 n=1 Tax=Musca autumnalis TaxID=221902 RepID=UPI003CF409B3
MSSKICPSNDRHIAANQHAIGQRSYSTLSMDDASNNNNLTTQFHSNQYLDSSSALSYCTGRRKRKRTTENSPGSNKSDVVRNSFSASPSDNLSRESIQKSCEYVDDLSDNDLIEVQNTPGHFQKRTSTIRRSFLDSNLFNRRKKSEESPLYLEDYQTCENTVFHNDEAYDALRELDAVLDIHDASLVESYCSASQTESESEQGNIEDCLLDLDDYLNKMDEGVSHENSAETNTDRYKETSKKSRTLSDFHRGSNIRKTIGYGPEPSSTASIMKISKQSLPYATLRRSNRNSFNVVSDRTKYNSQENPPEICGVGELETHNIETLERNVFGNANRVYASQPIHYPSQENCSTAESSNMAQILTEEQILQNLIEQNHREDSECRPRQYGRRAERNSQASMPECNVGGHFSFMTSNDSRPMSAPATASTELNSSQQLLQNSTAYVGSDGSTGRSTRTTSPETIASSSDSSESSTTSHNIIQSNLVVNEDNAQQSSNSTQDSENVETTQKPGFNTYWPHNYSRTLALISCTLGLFNVCRFAVLTINYGPNFLIQFLLLSIIFGIPFLWLQMCLGAKIKAGPVSMWKISPICSGIGISLVLVQYFITIYSSVVVVWLLVYLSDTFLYQSSYRWAETTHILIPRNYSNNYFNLTESIPDYFNINVLQRLQIFKIVDNSGIRVHISDRLAFYLAILWATVFLILCKGLRSFGKVIFIVGMLPLLAMAVVTGKLLYVVDLVKLQNVFSSSELDDFLINSKTWAAAAQETFLTWGLLGASVISISSRTHKSQSKKTLRRDAILVVLMTLIGLCLSALMGLSCNQILHQSGYVYVPGSYEKPGTYSSIYSLKSSPRSDIISYPTKLVPHYSSLLGEAYRRHTDLKVSSGYQVLRFVTELFPAVLVIAGHDISWIWGSVVFTMLLVFGIAQLCVMWKPISSALGNSTSAVLLSCVTGLLLSIPFATEVGITLLHYMDSLLGGSWFIPILWAAEIFGVFLIRGRPYNGDDLVNDLKMSGSMSAFLALSWNVLLPISLITLAVIEYKISLSSQLYYWRGRSYYNYWTRKVGALTQIGFLLLVPITAIIQIYRYLTSGPPDILDRIQMLYRPLEGTSATRLVNINQRDNLETRYRPGRNSSSAENGISNLHDDAPPKYTPPPSYTTATGARFAKILRQSIRRSVRRLLGDAGRTRPNLSIQIEQNDENASFPPDYSSVLSNPSGTNEGAPSISEAIEIGNRPPANLLYGRSLSLGRKHMLQKHRLAQKTNSTRPSSAPREVFADNEYRRDSTRRLRTYTAEDVITVLRSSTRVRNDTSHATHPLNQMVFRSIENLVLNAEPPGLSSSVVSQQLDGNEYNNTSVI